MPTLLECSLRVAPRRGRTAQLCMRTVQPGLWACRAVSPRDGDPWSEEGLCSGTDVALMVCFLHVDLATGAQGCWIDVAMATAWVCAALTPLR